MNHLLMICEQEFVITGHESKRKRDEVLIICVSFVMVGEITEDVDTLQSFVETVNWSWVSRIKFVYHSSF